MLKLSPITNRIRNSPVKIQVDNHETISKLITSYPGVMIDTKLSFKHGKTLKQLDHP